MKEINPTCQKQTQIEQDMFDTSGSPLKMGFDHFYGYNCQRLGHHYYPHHLWDDTRKIILAENAGTAKGALPPLRHGCT